MFGFGPYRNPEPAKKSVFQENRNPVADLLYLINGFLRNFSKDEILGGTGQFPIKNLTEQIYHQSNVLMKQGPFHKRKSEITDFILLLADLKYEIEKLPPRSPIFESYKEYFVECQKNLQVLFNQNILPAQRDWLRTNYKKGDDYLKFLDKQYAKKWERQLVITSKEWIKIFEQFYGNSVYDTREPINDESLESFTWVFDKEQTDMDPYFIAKGEHFVLAVVQTADPNRIVISTEKCKHLSGENRVKYICIRCKKLSGVITSHCRKETSAKYKCLKCWKSSLNADGSSASQTNNEIQITPDTENEIKYRTISTQFQTTQRHQPSSSHHFSSNTNRQFSNSPHFSQTHFQQFKSFPENGDPFSYEQERNDPKNSMERLHPDAELFDLVGEEIRNTPLAGLHDQFIRATEIMFRPDNDSTRQSSDLRKEMDDRFKRRQNGMNRQFRGFL
uniref:Uncharacterized protein n=1 Tax=Panagrolaimus sp. JU765 TaxID=591449 RepID=A0AC34RQK9_9BILA